MPLTDSPSRVSPLPDLAGNRSSATSSDPLLQPGSFIDASTVANGETLKPTKAPNTEAVRADPLQDRPLADEGAAQAPAAFENSSHFPTPEITESPAEPRPQRKRAPAAATVSSERPDWLPPGWYVEDRVRTSGATAGSVDKYYVGPDLDRRFRSKKEVMSYLETGSVRSKKKMPENSEADARPSASPASKKQKKSSTKEVPASKKQKKSSTKVKKPAVNFDFHNVPEKIKWVLADSEEGTWTPFAGEAKVPESTKQEWVATFTSLTVKNARHIVF